VTALLALRRRGGGALGQAHDPPDPDTLSVEAVLLATEERPIATEAITLAARIARASGAPVHVFGIARIWGTSLGFPSPGLFPSKNEWDAQRSNLEQVTRALRREGVEADGHVVGTRNAAKRIVREAQHLHCDAIVMTADPPRNRFIGNFMWSQEPQRVRRRSPVPVYLVTQP
jgi:nucleotide-binding universal stress UspA family protein